MVERDRATITLKRTGNIIGNLLRKELSKPPYRFTSFFLPVNKNLYNTPSEYQLSYEEFLKNQNTLNKNIAQKVEFIESSIKVGNGLNAFTDNKSGYFFYPVNYIKIDNLSDISGNFKNMFLQSNNVNYDFVINKTDKFLNYFFIEVKPDKKILILLSAPKDPDPFYPNNKRQAIIICLKNSDTFLSHVETFSFSNGN